MSIIQPEISVPVQVYVIPGGLWEEITVGPEIVFNQIFGLHE